MDIWKVENMGRCKKEGLIGFGDNFGVFGISLLDSYCG